MGANPATLLPGTEPETPVSHLPGVRLPNLALPSTGGGTVRLRDVGPRAVVFVSPVTGRPGVPNLEGWDEIPGARGCTAGAFDFGDQHDDFKSLGVRVYGLSSQGPEYQREAALRLGLPFPLLSDGRLELADDIGLPTFEVQGIRLYRRLTLAVTAEEVQHVFHPIGQPGEHTRVVLAWLREHR